MRKRALKKIAVVGGILVAAQLAAYLVYVQVEGSRTPELDKAAFPYEPLSRPAPALAYRRADGTTGTLADHRGRVVLVHLWATWCQPCRTELPALLGLTEDTDGLELLAVSVDDDWSAVRTFFGGTTPPSIRLAIGDEYKAFGTRLLPDSYLVDADGNITARLEGARPWHTQAARDFLRAHIRR